MYLFLSNIHDFIPTVSRPVRPGVRHPSGTRDQFFPFSLWLFFRQFRVSWCGAPSLTRSRVCSFQFLPGIASAAFLYIPSKSKSKSHYDGQSDGQSALVSGAHRGSATNFLFPLRFSLGRLQSFSVLGSYLTGNTLRLPYRAQSVNTVWGNSRCLLLEPYGTHSYIVWVEC
jgi:hypothetical protein